MKRAIIVFVAAMLAVSMPVFSEGKGSMVALAKENSGKTIAVVSFSANKWGRGINGWDEANATDLMSTNINKMLAIIEANLASEWKVVKAETFIEKEDFQALAGDIGDAGVPSLKGKKLPLFGKDRKQLIKATIDPETAKKIAAITGTDYVVICYSEWSFAVGKMVPTCKALAKNVMSVYAKDGTQVFTARSDKMGTRPLGVMNRVRITENTIDQWVMAYLDGLTEILSK